MYNKTPQRNPRPDSPTTPKYTSSLSQELSKALYERNLLTAKSRQKGIKYHKNFDDIIIKYDQ